MLFKVLKTCYWVNVIGLQNMWILNYMFINIFHTISQTKMNSSMKLTPLRLALHFRQLSIAVRTRKRKKRSIEEDQQVIPIR